MSWNIFIGYVVLSLLYSAVNYSCTAFDVVVLYRAAGSTKEELADPSQPPDGAELSLRPQGRKSIGESYSTQRLIPGFWGESLAALSSGPAAAAVGQSGHYAANINFRVTSDSVADL